jgi:hypothetical protein
MDILKEGTRVANKIFSIPEYPILIKVPRYKVLKGLLIILALLFVAILLSTGFFWYVTIPLYINITFFILAFIKSWTVYKYSFAMLIIIFVSATILFGVISGPLREMLVYLMIFYFK